MESDEKLVHNNGQRKAKSSQNEPIPMNENSSLIFEIIDAMLLQQGILLVQQKSALEEMLTGSTQRLQDICIPQRHASENEDTKEIIQVTRTIKNMTTLLKNKNKCLMEYLDVAFSNKEEATIDVFED